MEPALSPTQIQRASEAGYDHAVNRLWTDKVIERHDAEIALKDNPWRKIS